MEIAPYPPVCRSRRPRLMIRLQQEFENPGNLWHICRSQDEVDDLLIYLLIWERGVSFAEVSDSVRPNPYKREGGVAES